MIYNIHTYEEIEIKMKKEIKQWNSSKNLEHKRYL